MTRGELLKLMARKGVNSGDQGDWLQARLLEMNRALGEAARTLKYVKYAADRRPPSPNLLTFILQMEATLSQAKLNRKE